MQLRAQPEALCGTAVVDRSVFIKEPGQKLTADKVCDRAQLSLQPQTCFSKHASTFIVRF